MVADGYPSPALDSKPQIDGLEWLWEAYWELDTCRMEGMSPGKIPWTALCQYSEYHGFTEYEYESMKHCIRVLDEIRLEKK